MPLNVVSSLAVPKGEWTALYTTTSSNREVLVHCSVLPNLRPVPCLWSATGYEDVLNTNTFVCVESKLLVSSVQYWFLPEAGSQLWVYYELGAPFGSTVPVTAWLYS